MSAVIKEKLYIPIVASNVDDHIKSASYHLPWLEQRVAESATLKDSMGKSLGVNILRNFKNNQFKDKGSTLCRLFVSLSYNVKVFMKSTSEIFRSLEGTGIELMGLKGIRLEHRAPLIADSLKPGERIETGFSIQANASSVDPRRPLPWFSNWYLGKLGKCIPEDMKQVNNICYYINLI